MGAGEVVGFDGVYPPISGHWRGHAKWLQPRLIAIIALEPISYPEIVRRIRYNSDELEKYDAWLPLVMRWSSCEATSTAALFQLR